MKKFLSLSSIILANAFNAQVGINTENPAATLDVVASPAVVDRIDGLIAPRLKGQN